MIVQCHIQLSKDPGEPRIFTTESSYLDPTTNEWKTEYKFRTVRISKRNSHQPQLSNQDPRTHDYELQPGPFSLDLPAQEEIPTSHHTHQTGIVIFI